MRKIVAGIFEWAAVVVAWAGFGPLLLLGIVGAVICCAVFLAALLIVFGVVTALERIGDTIRAQSKPAPSSATLHAIPGGKPAA